MVVLYQVLAYQAFFLKGVLIKEESAHPQPDYPVLPTTPEHLLEKIITHSLHPLQ